MTEQLEHGVAEEIATIPLWFFEQIYDDRREYV